MLTYGLVVNACDEHYKIKKKKKTTNECLKHFVRIMQQIFEHEYIIQPSQVGIDKQMMINVEGGFFEIFIFLDCVHYHRKDYLVISQGQFIDKNNHKLIIFKAIVVQI